MTRYLSDAISEFVDTLGFVELWARDSDYGMYIVNWQRYLEIRDTVAYKIYEGAELSVAEAILGDIIIKKISDDLRGHVDYDEHSGDEKLWFRR